MNGRSGPEASCRLPVTQRFAAAAFVAVALAGFTAPAWAQVNIDTFATNQPAPLSDPPGGSSTATSGGGDIIGTRRGLVIDLLAGAGPTTVNVTGGALTLTVTNTTPDSRGEARLSWDNDTAPTTLNPTGLGSVNLTTGGASGFRIRVNSSTAIGGEIEVRVHTDATSSSRASLVLPVVGAPQNFFLPFSEFIQTGTSAANFSNVGAIEMTVRSREGSLALDEVVTAVPVIAATKVDALIVDNDSDTKADPGDRLRYTVTITNTGSEGLSVDLTDTVDANTTLVAGSVSSTPVAKNDQYSWFGNVNLSVDGTPYPTLLANDTDPDGDTVTISAFDATTAQGGTVTGVNVNTGEFTYNPPAGFHGVDSFNYTIVDNDAHTSVASARITLEGVVWFVDDSNTTPPHLGTLADPFQTLASVNGTDPDEPGDIIFLYDDDGTPYPGGMTLEANQRFLGQGVGLVLGGQTIVPAGGTPQITNAAGVGLTLAADNTVRGLDVQGTSGAGVTGTSFGTLTADTVNVTSAGGAALDLATGTLAATFGTLSSSGAGGQRGIQLVTVTGSMTATTTSLTNPTTHGIRVATSPGVTLDFGNTTITDNAIGSGATATGIDVATGNASASFTFDSLAVTTDAGAGLLANGSGTIKILGTTNTVSANGGAAVDITSTSLDTGATFSTLSSSNSAGKGVNLDTVTGSFTATGGSISGPAGVAFDLNAGASNVTYAGSVSNTANSRLIEVTGRTGGNVTFSGTLSGTSNSNGILVQNNSTGAAQIIAFSGATQTLNTGADPAVTLDNNDMATINFTGGNLDIDTTSGAGFDATNGAVAITVQGANNTISSGSGTALNVANTPIGGSNLNFLSISANGGTKGIALNSTGTAAGNGGLSVTGTGTTDGSGGTIQNISARGGEFITTKALSLKNINFTNANTSDGGTCTDLSTAACNAAIYLSGVTTVTLDNINVTGTTSQQAINGLNVSAFTLTNSTLANCGSSGSVEEGCIKMRELTGTCSITGSELSFPGQDVVEIVNTAGPALTLNVSNSILRDSQSSSAGGNGLQVRSQGTASMVVNVTSSSFLRLRTNGLQATAINSASNDVDITGSTFDPGTGTMIGMDLDADNTGNLVFNVQNNPTIYSRNGPAINVFGDTNAVIQGRINNNPDVQVKNNVGSNVGSGIRANVNKDATAKIEVKNNVVNVGSDDAGIDLSAIGKTAANPGGATNTLDATVTGNNVTIGATSTYGIIILSATNAADTNALCANVGTNAITRNPSSIASFRARVPSASGFFRMEGFVTNAEATWNAKGNTPTSAGGSEVSFGGSGTFAVCTAALPTNPGPN